MLPLKVIIGILFIGCVITFIAVRDGKITLILGESPIFVEAHEPQTQAKGPFAAFLAIHMEARELSHGEFQKQQWPNVVKLVEMADKYTAKLTLMFNPQWAEYILKDKEKFELVKKWQKNGHEIALHYHNIYHGDWNGYTNRKDEKYTKDSRYRGTVDEMMKWIQKLAEPDKILTMCMGPERSWDEPSFIEIDEVDYPDGIIYDVDGFNLGISILLKTKFRGKKLFHLKHHALLPTPPERREHLEKIQDEFNQAKLDEILGVVTHELDFGMSPEFFEQWFQFVSEKEVKIKTVRDIVKSYPKDKIVDTKYIPQEVLPDRPSDKLVEKVRKMHELIREKKAQGFNTSKAEELDRKSRAAAESGNLQETEKLLDEAIKILEKLDNKI